MRGCLRGRRPGIAGLTTAYLLAAQEVSVVVLDQRFPSEVVKQVEPVLIWPVQSTINSWRSSGFMGKRLCVWPAKAMPLRSTPSKRIVEEENIACEFARLDGFLSPVPSDPPDLLDRELAAAKRAGFERRRKADPRWIRSRPMPAFRRAGEISASVVCHWFGRHAIKRMGGVAFTPARRVKDVQGLGPQEKEAGSCATRRTRSGHRRPHRRCHQHPFTDQRLVRHLYQAGLLIGVTSSLHHHTTRGRG